MRQTRRFELLEQLLLRAAEDAPVLALFEDLHWADPISLDLWRRVRARWMAGRCCCWVSTGRCASSIAMAMARRCWS